MSLREIFNSLVSGKKATPNSGAGLPASSDCPHEADVLAYLQNNLSSRKRSSLEEHFADCDNCRELFAFFARIPDEQSDDSINASTPLTEDAIKKQTIKVLGLIQEDDLSVERRGESRQLKPRAGRDGKGFYLSYPRLAAAVLVFCAIAVGAVFWLTRGPSAEGSATQALHAAMKDGRRTLARISGDLPYSDYSATRGEGETDEFQLERALGKMKFAENVSAPHAARHLLARVHLAFNRTDNARQALAILEQLVAGGLHSAELFNDLGVAQFQFGEYDRAIESFSKALAISQNYGEALFNRAIAHERARRFDDAQRDWQSFINVASDEQWKAEAERKLKSLQNSIRK